MDQIVELLMVLGTGAVCAVVLGGVLLYRRGSSRTPLTACALLVAQLPLLVSTWIACGVGWGGLDGASFIGGSFTTFRTAVRSTLWILIAGGSLSFLCVALVALGLLPLLFSSRPSSDETRLASVRRTAFLLLLVAAAAIPVGGLFEYTRQTVDLVRVVVLTDGRTAEGQSAAKGYDILSGGTAAISSRIARGTVLGSLGAPFLLIVVFGAAAASALVGWPVSGSRGSSFVWLFACFLLAAVSLFWVTRLGLETYRLRSQPPAVSAPA